MASIFHELSEVEVNKIRQLAGVVVVAPDESIFLEGDSADFLSVSYTHLTLPTKRIV